MAEKKQDRFGTPRIIEKIYLAPPHWPAYSSLASHTFFLLPYCAKCAKIDWIWMILFIRESEIFDISTPPLAKLLFEYICC